MRKARERGDRMAVTFLFVRHGYSTANCDGIFAGNTDAPLTEIGLEQAKRVADFIRSTYWVDAVYASQLQRAWRTAELIAAPFGLPVVRDERLHEIYGGKWEGMTFSEIERTDPENFSLWREKPCLVKPPEGETFAEVQRRALEAVAAIAEANDGKRIVVVSHRCLLRTLQCVWEGRTLAELDECPWLSNCSVSEVRYESGGMTPVKTGQDGFLGEIQTAVHSAM